MRTLSRYILREFLVPLFYCLTGFIGIYVLFELFASFNTILEAKLTFGQAAAYFAGYLSPYVQWLVPGALMLAALYTMWNFCRHSEVTAMRANGIGFVVIVRPMLIVATVATLAVAAINEFYAPWAGEAASALKENGFKKVPGGSRTDMPFYNRPARRVWRINKMDIDNPNKLEGVRISFDRKDGSRLMEIVARQAEYLDGVWWLFHPEYHYYDEMNLPMENPTPGLAALSMISFPEFKETPRDFLLMNKSWDNYTARDMAHYLRNHPELNRRERASRLYDLLMRLVSPFACLVITLFAIPAGVATGRQSVFKGVISAVAMFFAYYGTVIGCMMLAKNLLLPVVVAVLLPDALFIGIGCWLFHRQR